MTSRTKQEEEVYLTSIFDKTNKSTIAIKELEEILKLLF
jgi:Ca2+-binding EF-hand superfamily protein